MSRFGNQFSASPVLTMAPHAHAFAGFRSLAHPVAASLGQASALGVQLGGCASAPRGRKRSRDEAAINLDSCARTDTAPANSSFSDGLARSTAAIQPAVFNIQAPLPLEPAAQPQAPQQQQQQQQQQDRHTLRSHKSQRLDQAALAERAIAGPAAAGGASLPADGSGQPVIDDFTVHLGIGWRRISEDVDIQAAARGWARYIENHYPISSVKICLESKGLQSYLVEAAEGYFLFAENLRHGRLVGRDVGAAMRNLQTSPPSFEGDEMAAGQATLAVASQRVITPVDVQMQ
jgi:hypothetical protein